MPIVVLIVVSVLSQMMVSPPPYSLYSRPYVPSVCSILYFFGMQSKCQICIFDATYCELPPWVSLCWQSVVSCIFKWYTSSLCFRSTGQTIKRQTENLHVDYYVTRDFKSEFKGSALQQIEKNVEEDYVSNVRNNCWKERQTSEWLISQTSSFTSFPPWLMSWHQQCFFLFVPFRNRPAVCC